MWKSVTNRYVDNRNLPMKGPSLRKTGLFLPVKGTFSTECSNISVQISVYFLVDLDFTYGGTVPTRDGTVSS